MLPQSWLAVVSTRIGSNFVKRIVLKENVLLCLLQWLSQTWILCENFSENLPKGLSLASIPFSATVPPRKPAACKDNPEGQERRQRG